MHQEVGVGNVAGCGIHGAFGINRVDDKFSLPYAHHPTWLIPP